MTTDELIELLNKSVITYRFASSHGETDYRCVELVMETETFEELEEKLGTKLEGRLRKQYE